VSRLFFGVVGDTRPPVIDDTKGYPTQIATQIWSDLQAVSPRPLFTISTGDYMFASASGTQAGPQMDLYLGARSHYSGTVFPAMGNHECTGATTSNCGPGTTDGVTNNYNVFMSKLLAPLGKTSPNYSVEIDATDRSWTSKFVFVAGNAWTSADATWLSGVLAQKTTYTFIVRHEPKAAASPGSTGSEPIMAQYPYTLAIVGHTHTYGKTGPKQVTIGNGGAPLVGSANYGYALIQQRADGAVQVDMIDATTGKPDTAFRFALHPDGTPAAVPFPGPGPSAGREDLLHRRGDLLHPGAHAERSMLLHVDETRVVCTHCGARVGGAGVLASFHVVQRAEIALRGGIAGAAPPDRVPLRLDGRGELAGKARRRVRARAIRHKRGGARRGVVAMQLEERRRGLFREDAMHGPERGLRRVSGV
jgi:hypothetical protein